MPITLDPTGPMLASTEELIKPGTMKDKPLISQRWQEKIRELNEHQRQIQLKIAELEGEIDLNTAAVTTNAAEIATNATGIATNVTNIAALQVDVGQTLVPQGRLTLTTATPVLAADVSGATTVYYSPYIGQSVPIHDGTNFVHTNTGGELSQATTDTTKSPAAVGANSNYDVFVWNDSGTIRATRGPAWSSATARGTGAGTTELERLGGVLVNKIAITNGPAAQRGTYVGTIRSNASSTIDWSFGGSSAGGTEIKFNVWNMYNRALFSGKSLSSTVSWTYGTSATFRAPNGSATNRMSFVRGLDDEAMSAVYSQLSGETTNPVTATICAIGLDSTTTAAGDSIFGYSSSDVTNHLETQTTHYKGRPGLGSHYLSPLEQMITSGGGVAIFYSSGNRGLLAEGWF